MPIDDPIVTATVLEKRLNLDRIEYRLKDGPDRLDVYYDLVPVTAEGVACGDRDRKHTAILLEFAVKAEVIDGIKVGDALAVLRKLAKRQIKAKESNV